MVRSPGQTTTPPSTAPAKWVQPTFVTTSLGVDQVRRYHSETPELFVPQMVFTATEAIGFS
jgi:hypothetical protein